MSEERPWVERRLLTLIAKHAYQRHAEPVTLASGERSGEYVDLARVSLMPEAAALFAALLRGKMRRSGASAIGGPETGAIPLVAATVSLSYDHDGAPTVNGFFIRKRAKGHGDRSRLVGCPLDWMDRILLVEDVVTSGASVFDALTVLRTHGIKDRQVAKILAVVSRLPLPGIPTFPASEETFGPREGRLDGLPFEWLYTLEAVREEAARLASP